MLALSPPFFSGNIGYWPLEDHHDIGHEDQIYFYRDNNIEPANNSSAQSKFLNFPLAPQSSDQLVLRADRTDYINATASTTTAMSSDHLGMDAKKLNHNASERDRRKKINHLYSSLRSLLPASDHMKKLSIPATVSRVLKYIPELQKEVEGLIQKREELLSRINNSRKLLQGANIQAVKQEINCNQMKMSKSRAISLSSFSTNQLNDKEVVLQISSYKFGKNPLSEILHNFEKDGFSVLNASSFESFGGRIFHNLHLKVAGSYCAEYCGSLGEKITSFCDNKELFFS